LKYLAVVRGRFVLSLVFLLLAASLTAAKAWIIQPAVDSFRAGAPRGVPLWMLSAAVLMIFAAQALFNWLYLVVAKMASAGIVQAIRIDLFHHLQSQSLRYFTARSSGDLIARVVNDVMVFEAFAVTALQGVLRNGLTIAALLAVMLLQEPKWGLVIFTVMILAAHVLWAVGGRIVSMARAVQESLSRITRHLVEMTGGIAVILGFGVQRDWQTRFTETCQEQYSAQVRSVRIRASATALLDLMTGVTLAGLLYWMGSALLNQDLTEGQLLSFLAVMFLMQAPAQRLAQCLTELSSGLAAGARAFELFHQEPEVRESTHPRPLPVLGGSVEFRGVSFGYDDDLVIKNLSFRIEPRELVVMVGRSGAGKSTVAKLAKRFYDPTQGQVLIDGVDLRSLRRESLHQAVSYVAQDVFLFNETVRFNITIGRPGATAAELAEVIHLACLHDVVDDLPDGLDTLVGERGVRLSGGQQQRIAIARALLTDARVLILDEATSALDTDLERRILHNLVTATRRRTVFAITHRPTLAGVADRVLVLRDGRLVEHGTGDALVAAGGEFSQLQRAAGAPLVP
jgi:subfamily B ATP-binding cassette protein MsbA